MTEIDLLIKNAKELLTLSPSLKEESGLGIIPNGAVAVKSGRIFWIGKTNELPEGFVLNPKGQEIDATDRVTMPGLIDSHTHLIFAGSREGESEQRIQGLSYLEIAGRGGRILSTLEATRKASFDELFPLGKKRLDRMLSKGVTTIEAVSDVGIAAFLADVALAGGLLNIGINLVSGTERKFLRRMNLLMRQYGKKRNQVMGKIIKVL
jgi:imidazolonepropionase